MSDITVTITPGTSIPVAISNGNLPHNSTHSPSGSDSVAAWYASKADLDFVSGQINFPAGVVLLTGNQSIEGVKDFSSRPTVLGTNLVLSSEVEDFNLWSEHSGVLYPYPDNDLNRSWMIQEKAEQTAGISGDTILFANPQWSGALPSGTGINSFFNTGFWAREYDWSCVAVRASRYTSGSPNWASTLITPRHFYGAKHVMANVGEKLAFVSNTETGYVWEPTVVAVTSLAGDAFIGTLNEDAPAQIRPAKIIGAPPSFGWEANLFSNSRAFLTKDNKVWAKNLGSLGAGGGYLAGALALTFSDPTDARYTGTLVGGDSSNGLFLPLDDGSLVLLGAAYSTASCTFAGDTGNLQAIRVATTGYTLTEHSLTKRSVSGIYPDNKIKYLGDANNKWSEVRAQTLYGDNVYANIGEYYVHPYQESLWGSTTQVSSGDYHGLTLNAAYPAANVLNFSGNFPDSFVSRVVIPYTGASVTFSSTGPTLITPNGSGFSGAGYVIDVRAVEANKLLIQPIAVPVGTYAASTGALTGAFYPLNSNPSGYVQGAVVRPSNTGGFLDKTTPQSITAAKYFHAAGFPTGLTISGFEDGAFSYPNYIYFIDPQTFTSGAIGGGGQDGSIYITPSETEGGSIYLNGNFTNVNTLVASGFGLFSNGVSGNNLVYKTQDQTISGVKNFASRPTVNGTGVLLSGEASAANTGYLTGYVSKTESGQFYPASNPSGYVTGQVVRPSETGSFVTSSQTGVFYPISNPSGYITGVDLSPYSTIVFTTGISGYQSGQISSLQAATGNLNTRLTSVESVTGTFALSAGTGAFLTTGAADNRYALQSATGTFTDDFYPRNNPSGYVTGVDLSAYATTSYVTGVSGHQDGQIETLDTRVTAIENITGGLQIKQTVYNFTTGVFSGINSSALLVYAQSTPASLAGGFTGIYGSITPTATGSRIRVRVMANVSASVTGPMGMVLARSGDSVARCHTCFNNPRADVPMQVPIEWEETAGTTGRITYITKCGGHNPGSFFTGYFNKLSNVNSWGMGSSIEITEFA